MIIFTHRGLDPDIESFPKESSKEAFISHLNRGFSIEFDIHVTTSKELVVTHNPERDTNPIPFSELLDLIEKSNAPLHAIHYKGHLQNSEHTELIAYELLKKKSLLDRLLIFDLFEDTALYFKKNVPMIHLAASVSHPFDIKRFNKVVHQTLFPLKKILSLQELFDWVWLDEWGNNPLYTEDVFSRLKNFKICVVSPELHATSPGLLGGESHPDGSDRTKLVSRLQNIIALKPDAICTDHPDLVKSLAL